MALQIVHHFLFSIFVFTLMLLSPILGHAKRETMPIGDKKTPRFAFDFINQLEGSKKGNKIEGIHKIKNYLHQFGYLDNQNLNLNHAAEPDDDDEFNDALESAIKTYQRNYHIAPTGILDATTVSKMTTPRCGYADIVNGINTIQPNKGKKYSNSNNDIHTVSHYRFTGPRNRRWPRSKANLTYRFLPNTPEIAVGPVSRAFLKWHSISGFSFSRAQDSSTDLVIGFFNRSHGDGSPFDGPGGVTAHAFRPTDGRLHYDADEKWSDGPAPDAMDLESIAVHEIGHLLGLGHSDVKAAIMYSYLNYGMNKTKFDADDINGIKALYRNWGN